MNENPSDWVVLAQLRRTQGRVGELFAEILTDFPDRFSERKSVCLLDNNGQARPMTLERSWLHKGGVVLKFAGIDSINDAEPLRSLQVAIPRAERVPVGEDEAYISDLAGCELVDTAKGSSLGIIQDVDKDSTEVPLLVVERAGGGELLVPFAKAYLRRLDVEHKRVEMELPAGLTELD